LSPGKSHSSAVTPVLFETTLKYSVTERNHLSCIMIKYVSHIYQQWTLCISHISAKAIQQPSGSSQKSMRLV
jgi:hypothetical protein